MHYGKIPRSPDLLKRARLLSIAGDETRIRILCFLFRYGEACVSDIAESLDAPLNTISHHLRIMKDAGLVTSERIGVKVCYKLVRDGFVDHLEKAIC
ncbi:MAG: winged helix-turn-helix transcriptional regulator [Patescibacteria group bacterium]|nr:winged helix-turn-helix transcriptional regulator [Patescibacteria group bacterium]